MPCRNPAVRTNYDGLSKANSPTSPWTQPLRVVLSRLRRASTRIPNLGDRKLDFLASLCIFFAIVSSCRKDANEDLAEDDTSQSTNNAPTPQIPAQFIGVYDNGLAVTPLGMVYDNRFCKKGALLVTAGRLEAQSYIIEKAEVAGLCDTHSCTGSLTLVGEKLLVTLTGDSGCGEYASGTFQRVAIGEAIQPKGEGKSTIPADWIGEYEPSRLLGPTGMSANGRFCDSGSLSAETWFDYGNLLTFDVANVSGFCDAKACRGGLSRIANQLVILAVGDSDCGENVSAIVAAKKVEATPGPSAAATTSANEAAPSVLGAISDPMPSPPATPTQPTPVPAIVPAATESGSKLPSFQATTAEQLPSDDSLWFLETKQAGCEDDKYGEPPGYDEFERHTAEAKRASLKADLLAKTFLIRSSNLSVTTGEYNFKSGNLPIDIEHRPIRNVSLSGRRPVVTCEGEIVGRAYCMGFCLTQDDCTSDHGCMWADGALTWRVQVKVPPERAKALKGQLLQAELVVRIKALYRHKKCIAYSLDCDNLSARPDRVDAGAGTVLQTEIVASRIFTHSGQGEDVLYSFDKAAPRPSK